MKTPVATCAICGEPILMDTSASEAIDEGRLQGEFEAAAEEHLRSHPQPVLARFWVRRYLEDIPPKDRALAVKNIYTELESISGDQDSRGVYSIDEVLGIAPLYGLWLSADACSYPACQHAEQMQRAANPRRAADWHRQAPGRALAAEGWNGTLREWRELAAAVARNCTCRADAAQSLPCPAHQLLAHSAGFDRLLFGRRIAQRLQREETSTLPPASDAL